MAERTFISLYGKRRKILIFRSAIRAIGQPKYLRFQLNPDGRILIEPFDRMSLTSFRIPAKWVDSESMEISTTPLIRAIYSEFNLESTKSYRLEGKIYAEKRVAIFDIHSAVEIASPAI